MKQTESHILVIFGASGDLTKRKLIPALYELHTQQYLPEQFAVLGVSRTELSDLEFREKMKEFLPQQPHNQKDIDEFMEHLYYLSLIHISEPTRLGIISYTVFCLKKKK